jgi:hypothetical protein
MKENLVVLFVAHFFDVIGLRAFVFLEDVFVAVVRDCFGHHGIIAAEQHDPS